MELLHAPDEPPAAWLTSLVSTMLSEEGCVVVVPETACKLPFINTTDELRVRLQKNAVEFEGSIRKLCKKVLAALGGTLPGMDHEEAKDFMEELEKALHTRVVQELNATAQPEPPPAQQEHAEEEAAAEDTEEETKRAAERAADKERDERLREEENKRLREALERRVINAGNMALAKLRNKNHQGRDGGPVSTGWTPMVVEEQPKKKGKPRGKVVALARAKAAAEHDSADDDSVEEKHGELDGSDDDSYDEELTLEEVAGVYKRRLSPRARRGMLDYERARKFLSLERGHASSYNFNCLAFSFLVARGEASEDTSVRRAQSDEERRLTHEEVLKHLPSAAAVDVFPGGIIGGGQWWEAHSLRRIERIFEKLRFMGEPHVHAFANRYQSDVVVVDVREKGRGIFHYQPGYRVQRQISMRDARALRKLPTQPVWLLLEEGHWSPLMPLPARV